MTEYRFASYPSLVDRGVLITGGATGIGESIVEHFVAQGARVAFVDLAVEAGQALAAKLAAAACHAPRFIACDLRDIGALRQAVGDARAAVGPITALINNAARDDRHTVEQVESADFDERIAFNLKHQYFAAQAVVPDMRAAGGGSIVCMSSVSWMLPAAGMPVYLSAKAGCFGLARGLARDLGAYGIRVNAISPGWIMTERQIRLWLTPESERNLLDGQCLKEKLYPPDIARMCLWLAADDSRMATAQNFVVDGGWT
jgi:NAD(P)-dependent dehydrogenase (short-subunit alcohol dehydrogenase family)